ncbi:MAG: tryptophan synthase subunit alpha [bacterium]
MFQNAQNQGEKLLSIFVTAGYPKLDMTPEIICTLAKAGADFVEIGMPFSDPIADGPVIQRASEIALKKGMNVKKVLQQIYEVRQQSQIPIILMGYVNPLLNYGLEKLIKEAEEVGIDGFIIPDLIPEEFLYFQDAFKPESPGLNFLISPNTPHSRIRTIDNLTRDFIYCVSVTGVTGPRAGVSADLINFLQSLKNIIHHPYLVGFGISNPQDAREIAQHSQGVIVGSAFINEMNKYAADSNLLEKASQFVQDIKFAIKGA